MITIEDMVRAVFKLEAAKHDLEGYNQMTHDARYDYVTERINRLTNAQLLEMISDAMAKKRESEIEAGL